MTAEALSADARRGAGSWWKRRGSRLGQMCWPQHTGHALQPAQNNRQQCQPKPVQLGAQTLLLRSHLSLFGSC